MRNYAYVFTIIRKHAKFWVWCAQNILLIHMFYCNVLTEPFGLLEESRTNAWKYRRLEQIYMVKYFPKIRHGQINAGVENSLR